MVVLKQLEFLSTIKLSEKSALQFLDRLVESTWVVSICRTPFDSVDMERPCEKMQWKNAGMWMRLPPPKLTN